MSCVVLVHGAFHGGWVWKRVAPLLTRAGHDVHTPTLTGAGDRVRELSRAIGLSTHVDDLEAFLYHQDLRDVVLVGHSYGGTVMTAAADRLPDRVAHLVFLDASAPVHGQSASGAFSEGTAAKLDEMAAGDGWLVPPLPLPVVGITSPADCAWVEPRRHPHPMRTLQEPLDLMHRGKPPWRQSYVVHRDKQAMVALFGVDPLAPFVARARREGWPMRELDAGHDAMITHPAEVAEAIMQLLR
jgi:pimeloyl-ACP methyl ester carboxylesterase